MHGLHGCIWWDALRNWCISDADARMKTNDTFSQQWSHNTSPKEPESEISLQEEKENYAYVVWQRLIRIDMFFLEIPSLYFCWRLSDRIPTKSSVSVLFAWRLRVPPFRQASTPVLKSDPDVRSLWVEDILNEVFCWQSGYGSWGWIVGGWEEIKLWISLFGSHILSSSWCNHAFAGFGLTFFKLIVVYWFVEGV